MRIRIPVLSALGVAAGLLLTGCIFSPGEINAPRVPAEEVATAAEDALEAEVGVRPHIDCGGWGVLLAPLGLREGLQVSPVSNPGGHNSKGGTRAARHNSACLWRILVKSTEAADAVQTGHVRLQFVLAAPQWISLALAI